jgi:hypothetical protein
MDVEAAPRSSNEERNARRFRDKYEKGDELRSEIKEICDDAACVNVGQVGRFMNVWCDDLHVQRDMQITKLEDNQRNLKYEGMFADKGTKPKGRKGGSQEGSLFESAVSHDGDDDDDSFGC